MSTGKKQYIHFSFDDVHDLFNDITVRQNRCTSVFENPFLASLRRLHRDYGAVFSLYVFNRFSEDPGYDFSLVTDRFAKELAENSQWLKFGFHAGDDLAKYKTDEPETVTAEYRAFLAALERMTGGCGDSLDRVVRLGWFEGTRANAEALRKCANGITGLLTADSDERHSYYLDGAEQAQVNRDGELRKDGMIFLRSQKRMELTDDPEGQILDRIVSYTKPEVIELFTHECWWETKSRVNGYSVAQLTEKIFSWARANGYGFDFAQNRYL